MVFERKVILKEIKDGYYSKNVWFIGKVVGDFLAFGVPIWLTAYPVSYLNINIIDYLLIFN
jgi:hypothetical protein